MLSNSEWVEIYSYLLNKISNFDNSVNNFDNSVIIDIERAATARIEENIIEENNSTNRLSKESRDNLDPIRFRAPTPREAFIASVGVLKARLCEVPALADRLVEKFDYQASDIQWMLDVREEDLLSEQSTLSAEELKLTQTEQQEIEKALKILERLIKNQE